MAEASSMSSSVPVFKIKLGSFIDKVPMDAADIILDANFNDVNIQENENGSTTYLVGNYATRTEAEDVITEILEQGVTYASVIVFDR